MWRRRCAKIILDKNSFSVPLLWLLWHFEMDVWSWLLVSFVFFLHWSAAAQRPISNKFVENERHLLLLFNGRPLVVGFNSLIWLVACYRLHVPRLTIKIGEDCNRCIPEAMVGEMGFYTSSLSHLFHHVVERSCSKWCVATPNFLARRNEFLRFAISRYLKESICSWIEMCQVIFYCFYWTHFRARDGKYIGVRFVFSISEASLVVFCCW